MEGLAPRTSLDVALSDVGITQLRAWMREPSAAGERKRAALVCAAPGSGLTTLLRLLAKEMNFEAVWIGTGTQRIKALLTDACTSPVAVNGKRKLVIVDEFDGLFASDITTCTDVLGFTKKSPTPFVCLAHTTRNSRLLDATKHMERFQFQRPSTAVVTGIVKRAITAGALQISEDALAGIVSSAAGNIREALAAVAFWGRGGQHADVTAKHAIDEEEVVDVESIDPSMATIDGLDVVQNLLKEDPGVTRCLQLYLRDPSVLSMGLNENYLGAATSLDQCVPISESFSAADTVETHMYKHQAWDVFEAYGAYAVAGPVQALHSSQGKVKPVTVTKFGSIWSKLYNQCAKTKNAKLISFGRMESGLPGSLPVPDLGYVRDMLHLAVQRWDAAQIRQTVAALGGTPAHALALMRLWHTEYKQTAHGKLKKLFV